MVNSKPAIETFGLSKKYRKSGESALHNLNISVMPGEVYGFLGPNGAGKSTTIRLLMNFIQPSEGHATILGMDAVEDATQIKKNVGYLPGEISLYPSMTGAQFLEYITGLAGLKNSAGVKKLARLFDVPLNRRISDLSKGNRQKVAIIQAFAAEPEILILDEPTSGLDPLMQETFFQLVRDCRERGVTIFFSSHNLSDVQKICDKVGFIRRGELIAEQTISELSKNAPQTYDISFSEPSPMAELKKLRGTRIISNTPHHVTVNVKGELKELFTLLARHKVNAIDRREIDLEGEFLKFYKGGK